jgi:hypothetical protein
MLRVVVDTNIWVSVFIKPEGHFAHMLEMIVKHAELCTAEEILAEAREVVLRPRIRDKHHLTEATVDKAIAQARKVSTVLRDLPELDVVKDDPDDNLILACALKAGATYLVSYDPHLTKVKEYRGIKILSPAEFLKNFLRRVSQLAASNPLDKRTPPRYDSMIIRKLR